MAILVNYIYPLDNMMKNSRWQKFVYLFIQSLKLEEEYLLKNRGGVTTCVASIKLDLFLENHFYVSLA